MADKFTITVDAKKVLRALERARAREIKAGQRTAITKATRLAKAAAVRSDPDIPRAAIKTRVRTRRGEVKGVVSAAWPYRLLITGTKERYTKSGAARGRMTGSDALASAARVVDPAFPEIVLQETNKRLERAGLDIT